MCLQQYVCMRGHVDEECAADSQAQAEAAVEAAKIAAAPLLNAKLSKILKQLGPLDSSKMNVLMAYAITSLSYAALRLNCVDTTEHAVSDELQRVQQYFKRIKETQDKLTGSEDGPSIRVDKAAARRLVAGSLGSAAQASGGVKRQRNANDDDSASGDDDRSGLQYSASRRSQAGVLGVNEKGTSNKSGASALGVAPKRSHLKWQEGLKAVASKSSKGKHASGSKRSRAK